MADPMPNPEAMTDPAGAVERLTSFAAQRSTMSLAELDRDIGTVLSRITELEKVLGLAPIVSKYHGVRGFEVDRFLDDYETFRAAARTLANKDG